MREFKTFFKLEVGRFFHRKSLIGCMILFILLMGLLHLNNLKYKQQLKDIEKFKIIEKQKIEQTKSLQQFGSKGFKCICQPSPSNVLYSNSGIFNELMADINASFTLSIENDFYGKNLYEEIEHFTDFSGILFLIGSFFSILYGYGSFRNIDYYRTLVSLSNRKTIFFMTALSRLIILFLISIFYILSAGIYCFLFVSQYSTADLSSLLQFSSVFLVTILFFFSLGLFWGTIKKNFVSKTLLLIFWGFILIVFNLFISKIVNINAQSMPSSIEIDSRKWSHLMNFEQETFKKMGKFTPEKAKTDAGKHIYNIICNSVVPIFKRIENENEYMMKKNNHLYNLLSSFLPGSYYHSVINGLSTKGYQGTLDFYHYSSKTKDAFIRWYFDRLYFCITPKVVPFIEGEDIVFKAKSRVPETYGLGLFIMLFYSILLTFFGYRRFDKYLKVPVIPIQKEKIPAPSEIEEFENDEGKNESPQKSKSPLDDFVILSGENGRKLHLEIHLETGKFLMLEANSSLKDYLYAVFSGLNTPLFKNRINNPVFYQNKRIDIESKIFDFLYLCSKEDIPGDIRVIDFFNLIAYLLGLSKTKVTRYSMEFELEKTGKARFNEISEIFKLNLMLIPIEESQNELIIIDDQLNEVNEKGYVRFNEALGEAIRKNQAVLSLRSHTRNPMKSLSPEKNIINLTDAWNSLYKKLDEL